MATIRKAVIYARFSSAKQTEQSIEGQLRICHQYAKDNDLVVVKEYVDRAKTAKNDLRPSFQKMLADSYNHEFDFVIVYALDRFARDDGDHGTDKRILQRNGVLLLSATQQIGVNADGTENLGGILTEGIYVALAKYYSRELAQKVRRGQNESLEKKNFLGGSILYGYRVVDKKFVVNEAEAEVVREMFELYSKGKSAFDIADIFKEKGLKNSLGTDFKPNGIMRMLQNRKYIGTFKYGSRIIEDYLPPIVNKHLFEVVQERIAENKRNPAKAKAHTPYILTGKLYCGYCKRLMVGEAGTGCHGEVYYYYKCGTKKHRIGNCKKRTMRKQELEDLVIKSTLDHILRGDIIENITVQLLKVQEENRNTAEIEVLKQQRAEVNSYIKNILTAIKKGVITESTQEELERLESERAELEKKIALAEYDESTVLTRERIQFWFEQFANFNINDEGARQYLVTYFINRIILYDDRMIIIYNHEGDNRTELNTDEIEKAFGFESLPPTTDSAATLVAALSVFLFIFSIVATFHVSAPDCKDEHGG